MFFRRLPRSYAPHAPTLLRSPALLLFLLSTFLLPQPAPACELCAIYNASSALGGAGNGLFFTVGEQFIPYRTPQFQGKEVVVSNPSYVDNSITHLVPGYNFSKNFGVSLNVPLTYLDFKRSDLRYSLTGPPVFFTEHGTDSGLGDVALIGRLTAFQKSTMQYSIFVNVLAGVKFPTGDASRLDSEVAQARLFESLLPPGTPHDPLGHSVTSVHEHMLALGSGSYDGVFGLTVDSRWWRCFFNAQFQYYLRTEGEAGFRFGDELLVSGGPGGFLLLTHACTLSLQVNVVYDTLGRDELLGRPSNRTGMTAWYVGPKLGVIWREHFSANAGVDLPVRIANKWFQSVPDYRVYGGFSWQF